MLCVPHVCGAVDGLTGAAESLKVLRCGLGEATMGEWDGKSGGLGAFVDSGSD